MPYETRGYGSARVPAPAIVAQIIDRVARKYLRDALPQRKIAGRPDVYSTESRHDVNRRGPRADTGLLDKRRGRLSVAHLGQLSERQPTLDDSSTELVTVPRLLSRQSHRTKLPRAGIEKPPRGHSAQRRFQSPVDRVSRRDRDLLFENDLDERIKSRLACPERGNTPTVDDRPKLGVLPGELQSMNRKCIGRQFQIRSCLPDDRIPQRAAALARATGPKLDTTMKKIMVCLKRVVDYNVRVRVKPDGSGLALDGVKMAINPFDEIALEEALRIRERDGAEEIVAVSIGSTDCQQQLRTGLAMGADRALLIETDSDLEPLAVARTLKALVDREQPDLVIMGKQAIDGDNNQTGQMLASLWDRPQATFTSELTIDGEVATATREVDAGLEVIEFDLPAVVTTDLRLNEPRYVKLPDIMKAKKKPLDVIAIDEITDDTAPMFAVTNVAPPAERAKGIIVDDTVALVAALNDKGLI